MMGGRWAKGGALIALTLFMAEVARADSTVCSDPETRKPGTRAELWLAVPPGELSAVEDSVGEFAESELAMSVSRVGMEDPYEKPLLKTNTLILQSPDVSVAVDMESSNRTNLVRVTIERTCYYDEMVPWQPYWANLTAFFQRQGYAVMRSPKINLRRSGFRPRQMVKGP